MSQMYKAGALSNNMFSMCMAQNGGYLSIGGINNTYHSSEITYIPYYDYNRFYTVKLQDIIFNGQDLKMISYPDYYTVIDSGTTLSYLPSQLYDSVMKQFDEYCTQVNKCLGKSYTSADGVCFTLKKNINDGQFIESMPTLQFIFENNVSYYWKPDYYLYKQYTDSDASKKDYCLGFNTWR